jgi:hypothetical protein
MENPFDFSIGPSCVAEGSTVVQKAGNTVGVNGLFFNPFSSPQKGTEKQAF